MRDSVQRQTPVQTEFASQSTDSLQSHPESGLQLAANNSPQVQQLKAYQAAANQSPAQGQIPLQRKAENISQTEEQIVENRAGQVTPPNVDSSDFLKEEEIKGHGANQKDLALVARDASSMAADPAFEARAINWELKFGGLAYNDTRAKAVVDQAAQKAVNYLTAKQGEWTASHEELEDDLKKIGIDSKGWSGGVGKEVEAVKKALTEGTLGVKIAHFENFANKIMASDILDKSSVVMDNLLKRAGIDNNEHMRSGRESVKKSKSPYGFNVAEGEAADQWHMRAKRFTDSKDNASERTLGEVEKGTGIEVSEAEKQFMGVEKETDKLPWEEGARVWALNERDKWVFAMRQLSLPLQAGVSGTTARMMQAFRKLSVGNPADNRLACIGYLLPTRHHSLTEIMAGAAGNGGPAFTPGADMYRKIDPFTETELQTKVGPFPDQHI